MRMRSASPRVTLLNIGFRTKTRHKAVECESRHHTASRRSKPPVMFSWNECQSLHSLTRPFTPKALLRPSRSSLIRTAVTAVIKSQPCYVRANCWWGRCKNTRAGIMRGLGTAWLVLIRGTFGPNWRWAELVLTSEPRSRNRHGSARGPRGISPPFRPSFCVNWCIRFSQDYFFSLKGGHFFIWTCWKLARSESWVRKKYFQGVWKQTAEPRAHIRSRLALMRWPIRIMNQTLER